MRVPHRRGLPTIAPLVMAAITVLVSRPAAAESISGKYIRKDEMNAVRAAGGVYTLTDLIDRRSQAPGRFDRYNQRLGSALRLGIDGLNERRALAPRRFDFYHPCLAYLLDDTIGASGLPNPGTIGGLGEPDDLPDIIVVPPTPPQPPVVPPTIPPAPETPGLGPDGEEQPPTVPPDVPPITPPRIPGVPTPTGVVPPPPGPGVPPGPGNQPQTPQVIPEPPGMVQLGLGLAGMVGVLAWRRSRGRRPAPIPAA